MKLSQNIAVGLLFFGALIMLGFFTIVSERGPFSATGKKIVVFFDNAEGIKVGSSVTVIGVPEGVVSNIDLIPVDKDKFMVEANSNLQIGQRVAITMELRRELVFYENYSIKIKNASLLGGKVVSVNPGSSLSTTEDPLNPEQHERIAVLAVEDTGLFVGSALEQFLEKRKGESFVELQGKSTGDPIAGLSEIISENRDNLRETFQYVRDIAYKVNTGQGTLGKLVNDDELHRNANTLVNDAQIVARELREGLEDTREQAPVNSFVRAMLTAF